MDFLALYDFIQNKMRMSHIYQPVMLITLLEHGGKASVRDIASSICSHDENDERGVYAASSSPSL